ncbi:hypothetical protein ANN_12940 [Periplaneta americana]|uniref:CUB domain-containing protein n=1 Tax=Periplaneta americana TaxID=6978 RepID=A0ABQ8THZ5_PERAM|nr:hypothetical protein ANN_12940 [Periplaneta americana]
MKGLRRGSYCERVFRDCRLQTCYVQSPAYPGVYPRGLHCRYHLNTRLPFIKLYIENEEFNIDGQRCENIMTCPMRPISSGEKHCPYDYIKIYDGINEGSPVIDVLPELLEHITLDVRQRMWFQHDGAPSHFAHSVLEQMCTTFPERWIGRGGSVSWPARSPDLTALDFLCGYVKSLVYETPETRKRISEHKFSLPVTVFEQNRGCSKGYVKILCDDVMPASKLGDATLNTCFEYSTGTFCGMGKFPYSIIGTSEDLFVEFVSSLAGPLLNTGFHFNVGNWPGHVETAGSRNGTCDWVLTSEDLAASGDSEGIFLSVAHWYPPHTSCTYLMQGQKDEVVRLYFPSFRINRIESPIQLFDGDCGESLTLYDASWPDDSRIIKTFCDTFSRAMEKHDFVSTGNALFVRFESKTGSYSGSTAESYPAILLQLVEEKPRKENLNQATANLLQPGFESGYARFTVRRVNSYSTAVDTL